MMNSPEIKQFIHKNSNLFWYIPENKKEDISQELLVETILNYGDMDAIRQLIRLMGIKNLSKLFEGIQGRKKMNYYPEIYHFLSLLIKKYEFSNI
ncbi:MAG: hypothetical protein ACYC01_13965 [Lutibacter sp.]